MYCPTCQEVQLLMTDRQGIEIDYCPQCRGVWLDRGELDKLIERATLNNQNPAMTGAQPQAPAYPVQPPPGQQPYQQPYNQHQQHQQPYNQQPYNQHQQPYNQQQQHYDQQYYNKHGHYPKRKKRESFLDDLFDFD